MIDRSVRRLLEQKINTRTKLHLLLMFHENPTMETTPTRLAQQYCYDIWSVKQSLQEMAEDGILMQSRVLGGETMYSYFPNPEYIDAINMLILSYDDPFKREAIYHSIREITEYASALQPTHWGINVVWAM